MEPVSKAKTIELLTTYGHVRLGVSPKSLVEIAERIDRFAETGEEERTAIFAPLRNATRSSGLSVWFPSTIKDGYPDSRLDLSGEATTVYQHRQCIIVHEAGHNYTSSTIYFVPALEPVRA